MPVKPHLRSMRLPIGFAGVIALMMLVTTIGVERMIENNERLKLIVTQHNAKTELTMTMYTAARERSITLLQMVSTEDAFDREEQFDYFNELATRFATARLELLSKDLYEQEKILLERQGELVRNTVPLQMEVTDLLRGDEIEAAVVLLVNQAIPSQDKVLAQLQAMLDYQQSSVRKAFNAATKVVRNTTIFMIVLALIAIAFSVGIAFAVIRKSRRDEQTLRDARDQLEERVEERTRELSNAYKDLKVHEQQIESKNKTLETVSTKLSKYLSPQVYASIFTGKQDVRVASQRKKLTIFFSDIAGFTETTESLEPEELTNLLNHYLTEMSQVAFEYGATIDKYVGDGINAFFGDPESRGVKEDARACVNMAIAMQRRMQELQSEWLDRGLEKPFQIRIGINTGFCTVGNFGSEDRMDYTINGSEVNLAARLESHAEVGGILLAYETYSLVKDTVLAEERDALTVKGFAKPVRSYAVVGLYDKLARQGRIIRHDQEGLVLVIDRNKLTRKGEVEAIKTLEDALTQMKG